MCRNQVYAPRNGVEVNDDSEIMLLTIPRMFRLATLPAISRVLGVRSVRLPVA